MYPGMVPGPAMPMAMPMGPFVPGPVAPAPPGAGAGAPGRLGGGVARDSKAMAQAVAATRKKTQAGQESRHEMRERMRYIMHEIDECNGRFISARTQPFQFLDVCCCPGGFSTYTLTAGTAPRKGIGLSLNPELGGHLPAIPEETDLYALQFIDVTTVAAGVRVADMEVGTPGCPRPALRMDAAPDEAPSGRCHLVIMDGSFLGGKDWIHKDTTLTDAENPAFNVYRTNSAAHKALLIAQLIIMSNNLMAGGKVVLRLNMFPDSFTIGVLGLLRLVFDGDVCCYKPRSCHVHVGSYYLVCDSFLPAKAHAMQWVPRWYAVLQSLRSKGEAPRFVPFPGYHLDTQQGLHAVWQRPMFMYHVRLWRFLKLVETAMEEKAILDKRQPHRPRAGRYTNSCGRIFAGTACSGRCNCAHSFEELHPFVQKAFREPKGYLWPPGHPLLAELVPYDPLPETVLELQQAQVAQVAAQAYMAAQAAAAHQQSVLNAAQQHHEQHMQQQQQQQQQAQPNAPAPPKYPHPNEPQQHQPGKGRGKRQPPHGQQSSYAQGAAHDVLGQLASYDEAEEYGMAGEWVHTLMRDTAAAGAGEDAADAGEDAMRLFIRTSDSGVVMEGGYGDDGEDKAERRKGRGAGKDEEDELPMPPVMGPDGEEAGQGQGRGVGKEGDGAGVEDGLGVKRRKVQEGVKGGGAGAEEVDLTAELEEAGEGARRAAGGTPAGKQGQGQAHPELLRMSNYRPRLGLVVVEVADDETLDLMLEYAGY